MNRTFQEVLTSVYPKLHHLENGEVECQRILAFIMKCNRTRIIAFPEIEMTEAQYDHFIHLIHERAQGVPFAYLVGEKEFFDLTLKVNSATLIPRPDTECLVEYALEKIPNDSNLRVLDMGTGAGAIALAIKKFRPLAKVTASDFSEEALALARENGELNQLDVEWIHSHWFENIRGRYDVIISNPPYIDEEDVHLSQDGVKYEPLTALVAKDHGYSDLKHLIEFAPSYLNDKGWLMLEHGYEQGQRLREFFESCGYHNIETHQDYGGNERITLGQIHK